jgi:hypothetical protein
VSNQPAALPKFKKKLTVLAVKELHRGRGAKGEWVMYEVEALDETGKRVDQAAGGVPLRTFDGGLPVNELVEYDVQPKDTERHGRTYTLFAQREPLWKRVQALEQRVAELEARLTSQPQSQPPAAGSPAEETPAPEPEPQPAPVQTW